MRDCILIISSVMSELAICLFICTLLPTVNELEIPLLLSNFLISDFSMLISLSSFSVLSMRTFILVVKLPLLSFVCFSRTSALALQAEYLFFMLANSSSYLVVFTRNYSSSLPLFCSILERLRSAWVILPEKTEVVPGISEMTDILSSDIQLFVPARGLYFFSFDLRISIFCARPFHYEVSLAISSILTAVPVSLSSNLVALSS